MATHVQAERKVVTGFFIHLGVYAVIIAVLGYMNYERNPDNLWFLWVAGGWGVGILLHAVNVFGRPAKREHMIQQTQDRMDRRETRR